MLTSFATIEGYNAGKHPLLCRYMKGVYNSNSSLPKLSLTWDAGAAVKYLNSIILSLCLIFHINLNRQ